MSIFILAILIIVLASTAYYFYSNSLKLKQNFDNYQKKYKDLESYTNTIVRLQEDLKKELEKKETYSVLLENKIKKEYKFHKNGSYVKTSDKKRRILFKKIFNSTLYSNNG
ncbi:hypothetical protein [Enterococcus faecalis]|uniref:hypothetical protein n=1 Tax=Enterococcus faecalis TaxID=1351 RepID=UPI00035347E5|nr:hypothetical protein [Enterococcus faecalis]EPI39473.1 hypothetical protein D347_01192 [Enterococcus faecalis LA3B-2]